MSEDPSEKEIAGIPWSPPKWLWTLLLLPFIYLLLVTQSSPAVVLLILHGAIGWAFHLQRLAGTLTWSWQTILLALAALAAGIAVTQGFVRWICALFGKNAPPVKAILRIVALFLSAAAAAIALSGVMHEMAWVAQKPVIVHIGSSGYWSRNRSHMSHLLQALREYAATEHHYPDRLDELVQRDPSLKEHLFYCLSEDTDTLQPIIYLRPEGSPENLPPEQVLLLASSIRGDEVLVGMVERGPTQWDVSRLKERHPEIHWPEDQP